MSPSLVWLAPIVVSAALVAILAIAATNTRTFPRLRRMPVQEGGTKRAAVPRSAS